LPLLLLPPQLFFSQPSFLQFPESSRLHLLCFLGHLPLSFLLTLYDSSQSLQIQSEEHVEGMLLPVLRETCELCLGILLQLWPEGHKLLVECCLLSPGESLPRGGVCEWLQAKLLVLQFLCNCLPLPWSEHQLVCVSKVNISKMGNQGLPFLGREPGGSHRGNSRGSSPRCLSKWS